MKLQSTQSPDVRPLPHALGPEKSILSSMLADPAKYVPMALDAGFGESHFYLPAHAVLFSVLVEFFRHNETPDLVSLNQYLTDRGKIDAVGGPYAITDIFGYAPNAGYFASHLREVRAKHVLRRMIRACSAIIESADDPPEDVAEFLDAAEREVLAVRDDLETSGEDLGVGGVLQEWVKDFEDDLQGHPRIQGLTTGYPLLDRMTGGLMPGTLSLIAARPSQGKSALMMNLVSHICIDLGVPVLVFSLEMTKKALLGRLVSIRSGYDRNRLRDGQRPSNHDLKRIIRARDEIGAAGLWVDERAALTVDQVRSKARRVHREKGIGAVFVDYLGQVRGQSKQAQVSREREVSEISAGMKALAKELGISVVCLAQFSRKVEERGGKNELAARPRLSDLRDSGSLEQDADLVLLIHPVGMNSAPPDGAVDLLVEKNRDGATGTVPMVFTKELSRFGERDWMPRQEPQTAASRYDNE